MNNQKLNFEEFCQMYPELLEQAREYAQGIIENPEEHDDAVESCICDFLEGARAAMSELVFATSYYSIFCKL